MELYPTTEPDILMSSLIFMLSTNLYLILTVGKKILGTPISYEPYCWNLVCCLLSCALPFYRTSFDAGYNASWS